MSSNVYIQMTKQLTISLYKDLKIKLKKIKVKKIILEMQNDVILNKISLRFNLKLDTSPQPDVAVLQQASCF